MKRIIKESALRKVIKECIKNHLNEISSQYIQNAVSNTYDRNKDAEWDDDVKMDNRIRDMRYKAVDKFGEENSNFVSYPNNKNTDNEWIQQHSNDEISFLDDEYKTLEDLYNGVKQGRLLIHCRPMQGKESIDYIYPEVGETVKDAYAADYDEAEVEMEELVFASDNLNWAHGYGVFRNGVFFVRSDDFVRSLGDGSIQYPNGQIERYYGNIPLTVESGDWYSEEPAEVVAILYQTKKS